MWALSSCIPFFGWDDKVSEIFANLTIQSCEIHARLASLFGFSLKTMKSMSCKE